MFVAVTRGIRVQVEPRLDGGKSKPEAGVYVYNYTVTIKNESSDRVQLLRRHWMIRDGFNHMEQTGGDGVVGQQPSLAPGESFTYSSFCPLPTPSGSMKGYYILKNDQKEEFQVEIPEFLLRDSSLVN
jgi:ApaG protein